MWIKNMNVNKKIYNNFTNNIKEFFDMIINSIKSDENLSFEIFYDMK